jgi:hypothetical protein
MAGERLLARLRARGWRVALLGALAGGACAPALVAVDGRFVHRERGFSVAVPEAGWSRVPLEGAELAFRGPGGAAMSLAARCGIPLAPPRTLARHLVIGLEGRRSLGGESVEVGGWPGWRERFEFAGGGEPHRLDALTVVAGGCVYDWLLLSPSPPDPELEGAFERWWSSFALPAAPAGGGPP